MKIFGQSLFVILFITLCFTGCDRGKGDKQRMSAAGHPDEIKDSTRFDAADSIADSMIVDSGSEKASDEN